MRILSLYLFFISFLFSFIASAQIESQKLGEATPPFHTGTSVAVSPRNNKNIIVYAGGKLKYTNDMGATWIESSFVFPPDIETPTLSADAKGNFYIFFSSANQLLSFHSTDDGKTWSEHIPVATRQGKVMINPGVVAHPKKEDLLITWTEMDSLGAKSDDCKSEIMMSKSGNGGKKWNEPVLVNQVAGNCIDEDFTVRGSMPLIAFDGKEFITWAYQGAMFYDRSYDGSMWISTDLAIREQAGGWTLTVPGFGKVANTPSFTGDNSPSRMKGTLFLAYSDLKAGEGDPDIWLTRSVSRGDSWTTVARINQDKPGHLQFLPKMVIDQANGHIYIVYYDRRDYTDNQTDVYLAYSFDGGNQFKEKKLTEKPFVADENTTSYLTNFIGISASKGVVVPVWIAMNNGKQETYASVIKVEDLK
ncbi:MAG: hypothetical protein WDO14_17640 [Bacteroidota bacterium]